jgi:hypothetical protein
MVVSYSGNIFAGGQKQMWFPDLSRRYLVLLAFTILISGCNYPLQLEPTAVSGSAGIAGRVWHDICAAPGPDQPLPESMPEGCVLAQNSTAYIANGRLDQSESGIGSIEVRLGEGACPSFGLATTRTEPDGLFLFASLAPGTYCVSIDPASASNSSLLLPGTWTYPGAEQPDGVISTQVDLGTEEIRADIYFAWDYALLPPYQAADTEIPATATTMLSAETPTSTPTSENTPTLTSTPTPETTPTPTLGAEDPRNTLKSPTWIDNFEDQSDWALYSDTHASFEITSNGLEMTAFNPDFFNSWVLSWRRVEDLYLETTGTFDQCSGRDAYGLMIRSTGGDSGYIGYLFGISCDGRYSLRSWDGDSMSTIIGWTADESIKPGAEATNRVGIWAIGDQLSLYANGDFLVQINDASHQSEGLFGLFVSSAQTANFTTTIKDISFWNLDE